MMIDEYINKIIQHGWLWYQAITEDPFLSYVPKPINACACVVLITFFLDSFQFIDYFLLGQLWVMLL